MSTQILSGMKHIGNYGANFIFGTGSDTMGKAIGSSIKNRKVANMSFIKSFNQGFVDGFVKSNQEVKASGGFFKNLGKAFSQLPSNISKGWAKGSGKNGFTKFFSKLWNSAKPLGKIMPFAMNALWLAQSVPDIVSRTKDEGIIGGIKETGKTLAKLGIISLTAGIGASFGFAGMLGLPILAMIGSDLILGKSYKEKKAEAEEKAKQAQLASQPNPFAQQGQNLDISY